MKSSSSSVATKKTKRKRSRDVFASQTEATLHAEMMDPNVPVLDDADELLGRLGPICRRLSSI